MKMYCFHSEYNRTISDGERRKFSVIAVNENVFLAVADQLNHCLIPMIHKVLCFKSRKMGKRKLYTQV